MKLLRFLFITTLAACVAAPAQARKPKKSKKAAVAKVDTVSTADFSYAIGLAQTQGLKPYLVQRMNVDTAYMADFVRGLQDVIAKPADKKLAAYAAGLQIGQQVCNQIVPGINRQITDKADSSFIDVAEFNKGFLDGINETARLRGDSAMKIVERQMEFYNNRLTEQLYGKNRDEGAAFLKENAKNDSVKSFPDGVQYKVLKAGDGPIPTAEQKVKVHYEGRLINGTVFDSSYKRKSPATFGCNQVIAGWTEALTHMPTGSTWEVYIPQDKAYGSRKAGNIPPYSTLIFKIELLEIVK